MQQIWEVNIAGQRRYFDNAVEASAFLAAEGREKRKTALSQTIPVPVTPQEFIRFLDGQISDNAEQALRELKDAVAFFDAVEQSSQADKVAVGNDHWERLKKAARQAAKAL